MATYRVITRNDAASHENLIHSDAVARRYGFAGGLVPGVTVFAQMTQPLIAAHGERWLAAACGEVRFLKPAYDGETLHVDHAVDGDGDVVTCHNAGGQLLARMTTTLPAPTPAPDPRWRLPPAHTNPPRAEVDAQVLDARLPLAAFRARQSLHDNREQAELLGDDLPLWQRHLSDMVSGAAHPLFFARLCNRAFTEPWLLPVWIHVGTEFRFRRVLRLGQDVEVRTVPHRRWDHKGHAFATLYIAMLVDGDLAAEAWHTAIYRPAERD